MNTGINWGDVATWFTGIITLGLFYVALKQIRDEQKARIEREKELETYRKRDQAEHVSSWIVKLSVHHNPNGDEVIPIIWVAIQNQSPQPVYEVIVNLISLPRGPKIVFLKWSDKIGE